MNELDLLNEVLGEFKQAKTAFTKWVESWAHQMGVFGVNAIDGEGKEVASGVDDEMDAFRHAFASAIFVAWNPANFAGITGILEGESSRMLADIFGYINELDFGLNRESTKTCPKFMDLHNNSLGRELAPSGWMMLRWISMVGENPNQKIAEIVATAVKSGQTINNFNDSRMPEECHVQSKQVGKYYIWRTKQDSKVRWDHAVREGKMFSWDNPPKGGHPGQAYECRCWAQPVGEPERLLEELQRLDK